MLPLNFDRVTGADVVVLIDAKTREGRRLDYKRELPGAGSDAKKEFLADVTSFANSGGGAIVFGVAEEKDPSGKNTGVPEAIVGLGGANLDAEQLRLEQLLRTGVEPRLPAHRFHIVEPIPGNHVLVLVIKQSWMGPHMVATADSRFYARTSAGKYALDVTEIRAAFLQGGELPARIRRFRDERLGLIASSETPVVLRPGGRVVLHLVPFAAMASGAGVDLEAWSKVAPPGLGGSSNGSTFNADGHVVGEGAIGRPLEGYVQLFRSGAIEVVDAHHHEVNGLRVMNIWSIEERIGEGLSRCLRALGAIGIEPPISILLSLVGVNGYGLVYSPMRDRGGRSVVTKDVVTLTDVVVEDPAIDAGAALRPVFDALWQTFGLSRSLTYDDEGRWEPGRFRW